MSRVYKAAQNFIEVLGSILGSPYIGETTI